MFATGWRIQAILSLGAYIFFASAALAAPRRSASLAIEIDNHPRTEAQSVLRGHEAKSPSQNSIKHPTAASYECGTKLSFEEVLIFRDAMIGDPQPPGGDPGPPYFIPIAAHIVRRDDGSGGLPIARFNQALSDANDHYEPIGFFFYPVGAIDYIDDDSFYFDIDRMMEINLLRSTNRVTNAVNVYFTENLAYELGPLCGISSFTTSQFQGLVLQNDCVGTPENPSTFSHEIGHYFDLFHTHEQAFGVELVNGSNCQVSGDLLCDTPADPGLSTSTVTSPPPCKYEGVELDPRGDLYDPDPLQIMSFAPKSCRDAFSEQALERARATLLTSRRGLLPATTGVAGLTDGQELPRGIALFAPRPNPSSEWTQIVFEIERGAAVSINIYDVRGARVATLAHGWYGAGEHKAHWDGNDDRGSATAPGIYFARMEALDESTIQKIQRLR